MISIYRLSKLAVRASRRSASTLERLNWNDVKVGVAAASTPPSSWYTDKIFFEEVEKKQTFRGWQLAARTVQLQKEGDYVATTIADQPVVVVRHKEGYRAFYNVCRHHAAVMCDDGAGNVGAAGRITCPYHGWQYSLDGRLAKAVKMKGCENFNPKNFSLHSLPVVQLGPWLFVNLGGESGSLVERSDTKEIAHRLHKSNYEDLVHVHSRSYVLNCNWKVFIDNYLDGGYHVPVAHPKLSENLDLQRYTRRLIEPQEPSLSPLYYLQSCAAAPIAVGEGESASVSTETRVKGDQDALYIFMYPNLCINRYGAWMDTHTVFPLSVDRCVVHFDWFVERKYADKSAENEKYLEDCIAQSDVVQQEDVWLCERVQRGLQSAGYDVGRYAPELEGGEYMFHRLLQKDLDTQLLVEKK